MKIEVGKVYRTSGGHEVTIMERVPNSDFPWKGMFGSAENGGVMSWNDNGVQCNQAEGFRLIGSADMPAETKSAEPLQLQVGKRYRTRGGLEAEITGKMVGDSYEFEQFIGVVGLGVGEDTKAEWRADGRFYRLGECDTDLVAEIADELPAFPGIKIVDWTEKAWEGIKPRFVEPATIEVPILDGVSKEVAAMAALENVMLDAFNNRNLSRVEAARVANWFAERYSDDFWPRAVTGARA